MSGLSFLIPNFRSLPKYSSNTSWQNLSAKINSAPSFRRNFMHPMSDLQLIINPLYVCLEINIFSLADFEKSPFRLRILSSHTSKYFKTTFTSQSNLVSFESLYGFRNCFLFQSASSKLRVLKQSNHKSISVQNVEVSFVSSAPNVDRATATVLLSTWVAYLTVIAEYGVSWMCCCVILGRTFNPPIASSS